MPGLFTFGTFSAAIQSLPMQERFAFLISPLRDRAIWLVIAIGLVGFRLAFPIRNDLSVGYQAIIDLAWTLAFWFLVLNTAISAGLYTLRLILPATRVPKYLSIILASALGLGETALVLTGFAFIGILSPLSIIILLFLACVVLGPQMSSMVHIALTGSRNLIPRWRTTPWFERIAYLLILMIGLLSMINALTPPWDYDGLMYHLVGPQLLLNSGLFTPNLDNWYVNGPSNIEMLFTIGLALGDDVFPKLIHYTFGLIFAGATALFAARWLSTKTALYSLAILIGIPALPIWAGFAYIDYGWAVYEFLAIACLIEWWRNERVEWIVLSGVFTGFATGSKYLGLMGFAVLGLLLVIFVFHRRIQKQWQSIIWFAIPAVVICSPWYLKNLVMFGNPVYPLYFGGPGWSAERLANYSAYLKSFGAGQTFRDYLLLPWNIYAKHSQFGAAMNRNDIPSLLFPLILLYPFLKKTPLINTLLGISFVRFILWAFGSQQLRFLMPIYPLLAICTAYIIDHLSTDVFQRSSFKLFLPALTIGLTSISLFYQIQFILQYRTLDAVIGRESRVEFLSNAVGDYPATRYIKENLEDEHSVMMLGDGRGYYCLPKCAPDPDHFRWAGEIYSRNDEQTLASWFNEKGFTHVLISWEDLDFLLQHDSKGIMRSSAKELLAWKEEGCLKPVFENRWAEVDVIICQE